MSATAKFYTAFFIALAIVIAIAYAIGYRVGSSHARIVTVRSPQASVHRTP